MSDLTIAARAVLKAVADTGTRPTKPLAAALGALAKALGEYDAAHDVRPTLTPHPPEVPDWTRHEHAGITENPTPGTTLGGPTDPEPPDAA